MPERILVCVAWPYANGLLHIGQVAGAYLPPDIFARYHRMKGNQVLMVSGSDAHGTPVTLTAERRGVSPQTVIDEYHAQFLDSWRRFGVTFDLFTSTHTENHFAVVHDMFLKLRENGFIYEDTMSQPYCETCGRFLADRYVEGTCPHCGSHGARGDQCDDCGRTLDPQDLIDMVCRISGDTPVIRETTHLFFKLSAFEGAILEWARKQSHWRPSVRNFTVGFLEGGLRDRAITRDIEWGVDVPVEGYQDKRIYVWFEAVIGYLSASKEYAQSSGDGRLWEDFWRGDARAYYFMGKDNIPFHTIIWPAMLSGYGDLNLPYNVVASEYLNLEGLKVSTSRNWAVWLPEFLDRYDPDSLRYVLTANGPETSDSEFTWGEYVRRNNDELVATYGNLVHRVLTMAYRSFDHKVPEPGRLDDKGEELLNQARRQLEEVGSNIEACRFRAGLGSAMSIAQSANRYLDHKAPWQAIRSDLQDAATTLWVGLSVINCLKTALYPFLPFSSERLHRMLGFTGSVQDGGWQWAPDALKGGQELTAPEPLFAKLEEDVVEQEAARLGG